MGRNVVSLIASLAVTALLAEGALRLFFVPAPPWREPQTRHVESPLLGWGLPPGSRSFTIDAPVSVNAHGLRDDEFPRAKPPGETRVLALGDSFTFALGVRFEDLYVQQLERLLDARHPERRHQVINAGVAGYNTRQELIYLRAEGLGFEPDLVTVGFYWNDLLGNEEPLPDLATPRLPERIETLGRDERRHTLPPWIRERLRSSVLLYQVVTRAKRLGQAFDPPTDPYSRAQQALLEGDAAVLDPLWEATGRRLRELAAALEPGAIPAVLVVFPMENQIRRDYPQLVFAERLREIWEPTGHPLVDLEPAYRAALEAGDNPFLPYDLHPNALGMRIAAEAIYQAIRDGGLLGGAKGRGARRG